MCLFLSLEFRTLLRLPNKRELATTCYLRMTSDVFMGPRRVIRLKFFPGINLFCSAPVVSSSHVEQSIDFWIEVGDISENSALQVVFLHHAKAPLLKIFIGFQ